MKALSLRQPWAWMVVNAPDGYRKNIENRKWSTGFRGEFLIHAAKGMTVPEYRNVLDWVRDRGLLAGVDVPKPADLQRGGIIGRAELVDVLYPHPSEPRAAWHMNMQFGFVLANVRPTPFVPCRGMLSFFEVPPDVLAKLEATP